MYAIVSTEILFLLISFLLFYKFKFNNKFICRLFKGITINLPLTDKDYHNLIELKKSKSEKANGMVRTCDMDEYTTKTNDKSYFSFNFIVVFFLCNFFSIIVNEIKNFILVLFQIKEIETDNSFNIIASFALITILYFVYSYMKVILSHGLSKHDPKVFYASFLVGTIIFFLIEVFQPDILNMNLDNVNKIVNDRFEKISEHADTSYPINLSCSVRILKVFYAIIFGLFIGILCRPSIRLAYFDNFLLVTCGKSNQFNTEFNYPRISRVIRFKMILNVFIIFLLIDPLVKEPLKYFFNNHSLMIYLSIVAITIITEFILGIYSLWYDSYYFHIQTYSEVVSFATKPTKEGLPAHRFFVNFMNTRFWEIILHIFSLVFYPLLLTILYYSRSQLPRFVYESLTLNQSTSTLQMKLYFFENVLYVITLAFAVAKGIMSNANVVYMQLTHQLHNAIY